MCRAAPLVHPTSRRSVSCKVSERKSIEVPRKSFEDSYHMEGFELGRGFSGAVRAAVCKQSGKEVAVKTYRKDQMGDRELTYMRSEVAIHQRLSHPGIVSVDAVFETKVAVHVVLERLTGGELFDRVADAGEMAEGQTAEAAVQLLQSLIYLHDRHIVHRDVKLENLMYEKEDGKTVKLIDLGFATTADPERKLTQQCGTPSYMAPELSEGSPYDEKVDIWSTGVCLYSMLTGRVLMVDGKLRFGAHFQKLSAEVQDFVKALLHENPEKRLSAREALKHPWLASHVPAQKRQAPPKPEKRGSLLSQVVPDVMQNMLKLGALGLYVADHMPHSVSSPKARKTKFATVVPFA